MKNEELRTKNKEYIRKPKANPSFGGEADILHPSVKRDRKPRFDDRPHRDEESRIYSRMPKGNSSFRPEGTIPHSSFQKDRRPRSGESYPERKRREARERGEKQAED